jgi:hypothetical protein
LTAFGAALKLPPMRLGMLAAAGLAGLAACGDDNQLPDPVFNNVVDTVEVYAISGTEVFRPSGYAMTERRAVRLDQSTSADFGFDITSDGRPVFLPGAMIGQPGSSGFDPGLQLIDDEFVAIAVAPTTGYLTLDSVFVALGDVLIMRSRIPGGCFFGLPGYGKLEVIELNQDTRTVKFQVLANLNCGYKGLLPGTPTQ